jgi:hypothetical protein
LLAILLMMVPAVRAQQGAPHLGYVYPAGGRQGTTFQVKIGGRFLDGVTEVAISGGGVEAKVIGQDKPLAQPQIAALREKLQELQKKERDAATLKEMMEIRAQISASLKRNANPALAEIVILEVKMAPEAAPGDRELRLATMLGLSNPLVFRVGQVPEVCEDESKHSETILTLPATVNGRIVPNDPSPVLFPARQAQQFKYADVDRFRFQARQGQDLVIVASARELIPYLADAVPGWFQAVVTLYDVQGKELAYDDDYRFHPDPVLHYVIPQDGDYFVEIKDAIYRGREDFVYRITLGELPFVTSIFPLGGPAGAQTAVELKGWNLPVDKLTVDAQSETDHGGLRIVDCGFAAGASRKPKSAILQLCAVCGGHAAGVSGERVERHDPDRASGHAADHHQRPDRQAGRLGCVPLSRARRRADRGGGVRPPARFSAGFRAEADGRLRPPTGVQRRL